MDDEDRSIDDALEEARASGINRQSIEPLEEDYDPPAGTDSYEDLPLDHPQTDTNIDETELYNEGLDGAAELGSLYW